MSFNYRGIIPASKSLMNRALICASYSNGSMSESQLNLVGQSSCDDVIKMQEALQLLASHNPNAIYDCGAAGTVWRFLSLRLSRIPGRHTLKGTKRLLARPQKDLLDLFTRLNIQYELFDDRMILHSQGWMNLDHPIMVQRGVSSQFASGLILNAWNLNQDLILQMVGNPISEGYLDMTIQLVKSLGMSVQVYQPSISNSNSFSKIESNSESQLESQVESDSNLINTDSCLIIKAQSQIKQNKYIVESDLSSAFAIAAFAALNGSANFELFPSPSLQPDYEFISIMQRMGIPIQLNNTELVISATSHFNGVEANLKSCPDLFPVLATLCAFAQSPSRLFGAPQLVYKESNRIEKVSELLNHIGVKHEKKDNGMIIEPLNQSYHPPLQMKPFSYDTDHDHRLAFAAALVKSRQFPITILNPEVVTKSFPEFWDIVKVGVSLR